MDREENGVDARRREKTSEDRQRMDARWETQDQRVRLVKGRQGGQVGVSGRKGDFLQYFFEEGQFDP